MVKTAFREEGGLLVAKKKIEENGGGQYILTYSSAVLPLSAQVIECCINRI
jgi:hypothetical protein